MDSVIKFVKGLYSLGMGSPFYRHSVEKEVPWPHIDNPLRNPSEDTVKKWIAAGKGFGPNSEGNEREIREEVRRLSCIRVDETELFPNLISNNLYKPGKVTYTSRLPYYTQVPVTELGRNLDQIPGKDRWAWRICDVDFQQDGYTPLPGYCILQELRISLDPRARIRRLVVRMGGKVMKEVQRFDNFEMEDVITMLETYLGIPLRFKSDRGRVVSLPLFFTRDPNYGLPIFVAGKFEIIMEVENQVSTPRISAGLEILHSNEEVKQIQRNHLHRVEDLNSKVKYDEVDRWVFINCLWRPVPEHYIDRGKSSVRLVYEGQQDEELRGVFWKVSNPDCQVRLVYQFDLETISLVDFHPSTILSDIELRTKVLPTTSGSFLTPRDQRLNYGCIMLSRYVDSVDCEPGLTPRNGDLVLEFDLPGLEIQAWLLTSKDVIVI